MRRRRSVLVLVLVGGLVPRVLGAQQLPDVVAVSPFIDPIGGLSVDQAISRAREREPSLQAARHEVDAARGRRRQSGLRPNPMTTFETRQEPGGTDSLVSIGVEWPLDLFRRTGRVATADRQVAVSQSSVADRERLLVGEVQVLYGRAAAAIREAQVASALAATVDRQLELVRARVAEGAAPRLDSDVLEVEGRRLQAAREIAEGRAERAVVALKPLLGMAADELLRLRDPLEVLASGLPAVATSGAAASEVRTDVRTAAEQVAAAAAAVEQASREGRVDLSLFFSYMRMDAGFPQLGVSPAGVAERVRGRFNYLSAGMVVTLPVINRNQGQVAAARAEQAATESRRQATDLAARAEIASATVRERRARQALAAYTAETRGLARRNLDVVRQTFELGRGTVSDVLAEQRRYLEFEQAYTVTLLEAWEARTELRRAMGDLR
jgi:cobalt-zinc-cadmium efflux system outer membrane protein